MLTARRRNVMGLLMLGIGVLGVVVLPGHAQAITFTFNCTIPHPPSNACPSGGSFGTVTLTDGVGSRVGMVEIDWDLTPDAGFAQSIERIFLNVQDPFVPGRQFYLVNGNYPTPPSLSPPGAGQTGGTVLYGSNTQSLGDFGFDITLTPGQGSFPIVSPPDLALVAFNTLTNPDTFVPLSAANFNFTTTPTASQPGVPPLFAGFRTPVLGGGVGEFWSGAPGGGVVVAEPTSLLLLGAGLIGLGALVARRKSAGKKASAAPMGS